MVFRKNGECWLSGIGRKNKSKCDWQNLQKNCQILEEPTSRLPYKTTQYVSETTDVVWYKNKIKASYTKYWLF